MPARIRSDALRPGALLAISFVLVFVLAVSASATARAGTIAYTVTVTGSAQSEDENVIGFEFTPNQAVTVDSLGFYDHLGDGLTNAHAVGIWRVSDESLITSVTIPSGASATLTSSFRFEAITPVLLAAGAAYRIAAAYTASDDIFWFGPTISADAAFAFEGDTKVALGTTILTFLTVSFPSFRSTANFTFTAVDPTPPVPLLSPLAIALLGTSMALAGMRRLRA